MKFQFTNRDLIYCLLWLLSLWIVFLISDANAQRVAREAAHREIEDHLMLYHRSTSPLN